MQNIVINGAELNGVPALQIPKSGGGIALFPDVTDTTAEEADVLSGKLFHKADGSLATGTGSGGTVNLKDLVLRPDAELVHVWQSDAMIVEDLGWTIPAYTTSSKTIHTGAALTEKYTLDYEDHSYFVLEKLLLTPKYSTDEKVKGKPVYAAGAAFYEIVDVPANTFEWMGVKYTSRSLTTTARGNVYREPYWSSTTALSVYTSTSYGMGQTAVAPSVSSGKLTVSDPSVIMRGSGTYFTSAVWGTLEDIRRQYRIELYEAPKNNLNIDGWEALGSIIHVAQDAQGSGVLT